MTARVASFTFLAIFLAAVPGAAIAASKQIEKSESWTAHLLTEKKTRICFVYGEPTKKVGKYAKRGAVFVQITHRPRENVKNEIGFTAGYAYKKDSDAIVDVDGKTFKLFTHKDGAWGVSPKADSRLVQAMMKGRRMIIRGISTRGTKTTDTYSLIGFTRAYKAIGKACKIK